MAMRRYARAGLLPALLVCAAAAPRRAVQDAVTVAGRVVDGVGAGVPDVAVAVHWYTPEGLAAAETVRSGRDGGFRARAAGLGAPASDVEVRVSARYAGVRYVAPPVRGGAGTAEVELVVYDTARHARPPADLRVVQRRILVRAAGGSRTEWLEIVELENPGRRTWLAADTGALWTLPLPPGAEAVVPVDAQVPADALRVRPAGVAVVGPLLPGHNQLAVRYFLPAASGRVRVPTGGPTSEMEILLAEPPGGTAGGPLRSAGTRRIGDVTFRRFVGTGIEAEAVEVRLGRAASPPWGPAAAAALFAAVVALAALWRARRAPLAPGETAA